VDFRCTVEIGGVRIEPGALVFGDREGVLIVPAEVEEEALRLASDKVNKENAVADAIRGGMSAVDAFEKFGVM
jgi:regulator of RNase E activity RraA